MVGRVERVYSEGTKGLLVRYCGHYWKGREGKTRPRMVRSAENSMLSFVIFWFLGANRWRPKHFELIPRMVPFGRNPRKRQK